MKVYAKAVPRNPYQGTQSMPVRLTEALLDSLSPSDRDQFLFDTQLATFGYRLTPGGRGIFFVGKPRRTIGHRPPLKVSEARERALAMRADIHQGRDPVLEHKAQTSRRMTVAQLAERWMADYVRPKLKPRTAFDYERLLAQHILPVLGNLPVLAVERADVERLHVAMARTPRRANYTASTVHVLFNHAIDLGLRPPGSNPARRIKRYRERKIERFLSEREIGEAAEAIERAERAGKIGPHGAAGLRLALFTGARSGEVTAIQWEHVDWQRRLIRLPDSKTNEPRTIHLSEAALEVLKTVPRSGRFVIAGAKPNEPYKNLGRAWIDVRASAGLRDVRLHDLRHSYASLAAGRGVSLQMIGKLLGHKVPATTQRYAHLARDAVAAVNDELGAAMQAAIAKGSPPPAKVVKLRRRR
jgi:integrase